MHFFVFFLIGKHLDEEKRAGLIVFLISCDFRVLWLFLVVLWVDLQCLIVVFPDTHFLKISEA